MEKERRKSKKGKGSKTVRKVVASVPELVVQVENLEVHSGEEDEDSQEAGPSFPQNELVVKDVRSESDPQITQDAKSVDEYDRENIADNLVDVQNEDVPPALKMSKNEDVAPELGMSKNEDVAPELGMSKNEDVAPELGMSKNEDVAPELGMSKNEVTYPNIDTPAQEICQSSMNHLTMGVNAVAESVNQIDHSTIEKGNEAIETKESLPCVPSAPQTHMYPALPMQQIQHPKINYEFEQEIEANEMEIDGERPLTEEQLRSFYSNPLLDVLDDHVDEFIQKNISLNQDDHFYRLLADYLQSLRTLETQEKVLKEAEYEVKSLLAVIWSLRNEKISMQGKCGDNNPASGESCVQVAVLNGKNLKKLSNKLAASRDVALNKKAVASHNCSSLRLQCQWIVSNASLSYLQENKVTQTSPACVTNPVDSECRRNVMHCLDVLFHFLRQPLLPRRFTDNLKQWIEWLVSCVLKCMNEMDEFYLLNQLLRCAISLEDWGAAGFIQPICGGLPRDKNINHFVSLLSCLISPVRRREEFLEAVINEEMGDEAWTILDGAPEEEESRLVAVTESDLLALLKQFNFDHLFAKFLDGISEKDSDMTNSLCLRVFAFELTFLKVLADGMHTYDRDAYRQICRQLGYVMRQSVQYVAEFWDACKLVDSLNLAQLQMELDRLLLVVMYCFIASRRLGVWQFLVDLPYSSTSEDCLWRALYLLSSTHLPRLHEICTINAETVLASFAEHETLGNRAASLGDSDTTYLFIAATRVACQSDNTTLAQYVTEQILQTCFIDEKMRASEWKVGQECLGVILHRHPGLFSFVIKFIDRSLTALDSYCDDMLSSTPMYNIMATVDDISLLGKWLVANSPDTAPNKLAQQILSGFDWGPRCCGGNVLPPQIHVAAAQALVSAHHAHCSVSNSLISVSWRKASKMASRIPDAETKFDSFCWIVVLKLKIPFDFMCPLISQSTNLLANFLTASQLAATPGASSQLNNVSVLENLVNSNCFVAAIALLTSFVSNSRQQQTDFSQNLCGLLDRLVNADSSSYFSYLIGSTTPSTNSQFLASSITNCILCAEGDRWIVSTTWICLLTKCKSTWNTDANILFVLDRIVQCSFIIDSSLVPVRKELANALQRLIEGNSTRGMLAWFSSNPPVTQMIKCDKWHNCHYLSYCSLLAEQDVYQSMHSLITANLVNNPSTNLEQAINNAATKTHLSVTHKDLMVYRWAEYICNCEYDSCLASIACQQLMLQLLARHPSKNGAPKCVGLRYLRAACMKPLWDILSTNLDSKINKCQESTDAFLLSRAELFKAVKSWMSDVRLYTPDGAHLEGVPLDFLVHLLMSGDKELWTHYIYLDACLKECHDFGMMHAHLRSLVPSTSSSNPCPPPTPINSNALQRLCSRLRSNSESNKCTCAPSPNIPLPMQMPNLETLKQSRAVICLVSPALQSLSNAARSFSSICESLAIIDLRVVEILPKLYSKLAIQTSVILKCTSSFQKCKNPNTVKVQVEEWMLSTSVQSHLEDLQRGRAGEMHRVEGSPWIDDIPKQTAVVNQALMALVHHLQTSDKESEDYILLHDSGICLLAQLISSFHASLLSCPITRAAYSHWLDTLAVVFISGQPTQQCQLLDWIVDRDDLVQFLAPHFSPSVLSGHLFVQVYEKLQTLFKNTSFSREALLALFSKLDINHSLTKCSPPEINLLMQFVNSCLVSSRKDTKLHDVLSSHWCSCALYSWPHNFIPALNIMLRGCANVTFPSDVLDSLVSQIFSQPPLNPATADTVCGVLTDAFVVARQKYSLGLFSAWKDYLPSVSNLSSLFLKQASLYQIESTDLNVIEDGLRLWFDQVCHVFSALIDPVAQVCPPWTPDSNEVGAVVIENFIDVLIFLHSKTERVIPWGCQNVTSLFWQYYASKLACMKRASSHVITAWQTPALKLPWKTFCPSLMAMDSFRQVIEEGPDESKSLVTCIFVRIDWTALTQYSYKHQPTDAQKLFMNLLLFCSLSCSANPDNYQDCKASFPRMLQDLCNLPWVWLDNCKLSSTLRSLSESLSPSIIIQPDQSIHQITLSVVVSSSEFESICVESVVESVDYNDRVLKQEAYVAFYLCLLRRGIMERSCTMDRAQQLVYQLLDDTTHVLIPDDNLRSNNCALASHFITFIATQADGKSIDTMICAVIGWVLDHPDSLLIQFFLSTSATPALPLPSAFNLIEHCLQAHFLKSNTDPLWNDVIDWVKMPTEWERMLRRDQSEGPWLLTLHAILSANLLENDQNQLDNEANLIKDLVKLFAAIKAKPVSEEAGVVLLLGHCLRLIIRQFTFGSGWSTVGQHLLQLTSLCLLAGDEKQGFLGAIGISRKKMFSTKLKLVCLVVGAYLTQQTLSESEEVRLRGDVAVLQSRVQMIKDMKNNKYLSPYSNAIQDALHFFVDPTKNLLHAPQLLSRVAKQVFIDKCLNALPI